jgi:uncharacterized protein YqeY
MSLKARLLEDIKTAMRSGDKARLQTLRLASAALKQREVDERTELDDAAVMAILEKMIKQRRDAQAQFAEAGREELARQEADEIEVLQAYLPAQLDDAAIAGEIDALIQRESLSGMQDMGRAMGLLKQRLQGQADMARVSTLLRERLQSA